MDRTELRAELLRKGINQRTLAAALGISENALYQKLKGREFKESEIRKIADMLCLTAEDINRFFFVPQE